MAPQFEVVDFALMIAYMCHYATESSKESGKSWKTALTMSADIALCDDAVIRRLTRTSEREIASAIGHATAAEAKAKGGVVIVIAMKNP